MNDMVTKMHKNRDNRMKEGIELYKAGDLDRAFKVFERISRDFPGDPESIFNCGVIFDSKGLKRKAIESMQEALHRDPNFAKAKLNLAVYYYEIGKVTEAANLLRETQAINVPEWIRERAFIFLKRLEHSILKDLAMKSAQIDKGLISGIGIREIGKNIGVLLGRPIAYCDLSTSDRGNIFIVKTEDAVYHARVENGDYLEIRDQIDEDVVLFRELPDVKLVHSAKVEEIEEQVEQEKTFKAEINFDNSDSGYVEFLQGLHVICEHLKRKPDKLCYILHGINAGDWKAPVTFKHDDWEGAIQECKENPYGWQIDFYLKLPEGEIEGHANPGFDVEIIALGNRGIVETVERLILKTKPKKVKKPKRAKKKKKAKKKSKKKTAKKPKKRRASKRKKKKKR